jgi:hypothetical protein
MPLASRLILALVLALLVLPGVSCGQDQGFEKQLGRITRPYLFDFLGWEGTSLLREANQLNRRVDADSPDSIGAVLDYFRTTAEARATERRLNAAATTSPTEEDVLRDRLDDLREQARSLRGRVERIIETQVRDTFARQGILNPAYAYTGLRVTFPPMNFRLDQPPRLLVISPRDRIATTREVTLQPDLELGVIEKMEAETDALGVSSLVVELGGLGATYPTFVTDDASLRFTLEVVAEEWLHQYLAFRPLGFLYVLDLTGIQPSYEIATINETVAGIISEEIGRLVVERYYGTVIDTSSQPVDDSRFDFDREMRETRQAVDAYLERGEVEQAERFMEQQRQYLASRGHYIRKLNQAYFAFHGVYADEPTSISPIGRDLRQLRADNPTLRGFLETASTLTGHQSLLDVLGR